MQPDLEKIDILKDVTYTPDIRGPALLVSWRKIPMGFIRPLNRVPSLGRGASKEARQSVRQQYKQQLGKWTASLIGGGYFDTKEEAARHVVLSFLRGTAVTSPLFQAALREDYGEVARLLRKTREQVIVDPTACFLILDNERLGLNRVAEGKWIARGEGGISRIAKRKKLRQLHEYVSQSSEEGAAFEEAFGKDLRFPEPAWFDPDEGLAWVAKMANYLEANPGAVSNAEGVLADLREFEAVLRTAQAAGARWHLQMRS